MQITNIRIRKSKNEDSSILGNASIQLDDCLVIHGIKLIKLNDGRRIISFPNRLIKKYNMIDGQYTESMEHADIVHPSNTEFRNYIQTKIFEIYDEQIGE